MRIVCGPSTPTVDTLDADLKVLLYGRQVPPGYGSAGAAIAEKLRRKKLSPTPRAWDFLSIALAVTAADLAGHRNRSSDGWTREFNLTLAVAEPKFWTTQVATLQELLSFLTTDRWTIGFIPGAPNLDSPAQPIYPENDCAVLLSGGLDSFTGALDLVARGHSPLAVSQSVRGDAAKQRSLAGLIGGGLAHIQLNHNSEVPDPESPPTQRARSIAFLAYGVLTATALRRHADGGSVPLFVCENGFIALNPPLTGSRLGSLSTRTCHPVVLRLLQRLLDEADLRVRLENPCAYLTKGEMLVGVACQDLLRQYAHETTSCGRFKRHGYRHCGRCVPCLIRRSAFHCRGVADRTEYVYSDLSIDDLEHARSDDVRAAAIAVAEAADIGVERWLGATLSSPLLGRSVQQLREVASRGLTEIGSFLEFSCVR